MRKCPTCGEGVAVRGKDDGWLPCEHPSHAAAQAVVEAAGDTLNCNACLAAVPMLNATMHNSMVGWSEMPLPCVKAAYAALLATLSPEKSDA